MPRDDAKHAKHEGQGIDVWATGSAGLRVQPVRRAREGWAGRSPVGATCSLYLPRP